MSTTATAEPIARNSVMGHIEFSNRTPDVETSRTRPANPEELTEEERARLWAKSKNYDEFTDNAIAYGKLTGDFTIDRHILPQPSLEEIFAGAARIVAEHPERTYLSRKELDALRSPITSTAN